MLGLALVLRAPILTLAPTSSVVLPILVRVIVASVLSSVGSSLALAFPLALVSFGCAFTPGRFLLNSKLLLPSPNLQKILIPLLFTLLEELVHLLFGELIVSDFDFGGPVSVVGVRLSQLLVPELEVGVERPFGLLLQSRL